MGEQRLPEVEAKRSIAGHEHDWRVVPNQVVREVKPGAKRWRVRCAICRQRAYIDSPPKPLPALDDIQTWRKWRWDE